MTAPGAHAAGFNGASIRAEGSALTVGQVRFANDEDGVLAGSIPDGRMIVRDSIVTGNGSCAGSGCAHSIHVGHIALLHARRSRFFNTRDGHAIKSRALRPEVTGCDLADGAIGTSSFAIDMPNGGSALMQGNHTQKGPVIGQSHQHGRGAAA